MGLTPQSPLYYRPQQATKVVWQPVKTGAPRRYKHSILRAPHTTVAAHNHHYTSLPTAPHDHTQPSITPTRSPQPPRSKSAYLRPAPHHELTRRKLDISRRLCPNVTLGGEQVTKTKNVSVKQREADVVTHHVVCGRTNPVCVLVKPYSGTTFYDDKIKRRKNEKERKKRKNEDRKLRITRSR